MRWMFTLVVVATLGLVYWLGNRIYWWRKAFDGTAWTVTSEGASESLYAAGVLGLNDLTVRGDAVGKGSLPDSPDTPNPGYGNGNGDGSSSSSSSSSSSAPQDGDCDVSLNGAQLVWEQVREIVRNARGVVPSRSETLDAWCRCQDRTYQEYFRWCDPLMEGFNG